MSRNIDDSDDETKKIVIPKYTPEELTELRELALHILKKSLNLRSAKEKKSLQDYAASVEFFQKILLGEGGPKKIAELCDNLTYHYLEPSEVLFLENSIGTAFYIILEGSVHVLVDKWVKNEAGKDVKERVKVGEMHAGKSFGEFALLGGVNGKRTATICGNPTNPCHLAVLERAPFQRILESLSQEIPEQIEFLENTPFFKHLNLSARSIQQFINFFELKAVYPMNHVIYREGEPCEDIYLVRSGELKCIKTIQIKNPATNFLIDEHNKLYPYDSAVITKQIDLGIIVQGHLFGDEEALMMQFMRLKEEAKANGYLKSKVPSTEREQFIMEIQSLLLQGSIDKAILPPPKTPEGLRYRRNSLGKTEIVTRESTVIVKSTKAEIWKIPARTFFKHLDTNVAAHQYLYHKTEQARRRREERLPSQAKFVPAIFSTRSKQIPSDESFLSVIKQKKYAKQQFETLSLQNEIEKSMDLSYADSSLAKPHSPENERLSSPKKNLLDITIVPDVITPTPIASPAKEANTSSPDSTGIGAPKSLLLHKVNGFQEPDRKKTEPLLLVQGFLSHTESPMNAKRSYRGDKDANKINRISTKRASVPVQDLATLNDSLASAKNLNSPVKVSRSTKHPQAVKQITHRGKSATPNRARSLYDEDSPHCLFSKDPEKKQKKAKLMALTPIRPRPTLSQSPSKTPFQQMLHMRSMPVEYKQQQSINIHIQLKERVKRTNTIDLSSRREKQTPIPRLLDRNPRVDIRPPMRSFSKPTRERVDLVRAMRITGFTKANDSMQSFFFGTDEERINTSMSFKMKPKFQ